MKNRRVIMWLALSLLLSIGAHLILSCKGGADAALVQKTTLVDPSLENATRIKVEQPGERTIVLEKTSHWRIVEPYNALADERVILKLLDLLTSGEIEGMLSSHELARLGRTREDFGLDGDFVKVELSGSGKMVRVFFGSKTPAEDGVYASVEGEDAIYVAPVAALESAKLTPAGFRQKAILPSWSGAVVSFDIKHALGAFMRFTHDGETWLMREPVATAANSGKVKKLLVDIGAAEAKEFIWPVGAKGESAIATVSLLAGYGLDPESAVTLTLKCADGVDRQISFGKTAKNGMVYALVQNAQAIVMVDGFLKDEALAGEAAFTDSRIVAVDKSTSTRLSIVDGEVNYLLAKGDDGLWRIDAPVAAPADQDCVNSLFDNLSRLKSEDVVLQDGLSISVSTSAVPVCVSREAALGSMRLDSLRSREILNMDRGQIKRIVVTHRDDSPTAIIYDKDRRAWNVERSARPGTVEQSAIDAVIAGLNPLSAVEVVRLKVSAADLRKYGLERPGLTIAIDQDREDSVRKNLLFGYATENGVYATLGANDAVFLISHDVFDRFSARLIKE